MAYPTRRGDRRQGGHSDDSTLSDGGASPPHTNRRDNMNRGGRSPQGQGYGRRLPNDHYQDDGYWSEESQGRAMRENERLKAQVNELQLAQADDRRHIKSLKDENRTLQRKFDRDFVPLREENEFLKRKFDRDFVPLGEENKTLKESNRILNQDIGLLKRNIDRDLVSIREENKNLKESRRILVQDNKTLIEDNKAVIEGNRILKHEYSSLEERFDHLQVDLERRGQLVKSTKRMLQDEKHDAAERQKVYEANIKSVQRECDNYRRACSTSEENRATLERTKQTLEENLAAERGRVALLQTTIQNIQGEITRLNNQVHRLEADNQNIRHHNHCLTLQLDETIRDLEEKDATLDQINTAREGIKVHGKARLRQRANGEPELFRPHK